MRTSEELFSSLEDGATVDLAGETITSVEVRDVPRDVTIANGVFEGHMEIHDAVGVTFTGCHFEADTSVEEHSLLKFLGGHGWQVLDCSFIGGWVGSHLGIGLNPDGDCPTDWLVQGCLFGEIGKQWGSFPQGHSMYVLTDPQVEMGGRIDACVMRVGKVGSALKLGGTGFRPRREGCRGVLVTDCTITGVVADDGRALAVLSQGGRTDVTLRGCTLLGEGAPPTVQAMDGATCRLEGTKLPDGVVNHATWYRWGIWARSTKTAVAGRPRSGVRWD